MKATRNLVNIFCIIGSLGMFPSAHAVTVSFIAPGWGESDFAVLSAPTRSIEFDSNADLYIEDISDDDSGTIRVLKLDAATGYSASSEFVSYSTTYQGVTGLDFDGLGNLIVSERSLDGDAGIIRNIDVATQTLTGDVRSFANHRPTGVDADNSGNIYYTGRKNSDGTFGNVYQIDSTGTRSILIDNVVGTGIALDAAGRIFISTPARTGLPLQEKSIYMYDPSDLLNPVRIATFLDAPGGELTFDDAGNLYVIDNVDNVSVTKLSAVPIPATVWLFGSGLIGLLSVIRRKGNTLLKSVHQ